MTVMLDRERKCRMVPSASSAGRSTPPSALAFGTTKGGVRRARDKKRAAEDDDGCVVLLKAHHVSARGAEGGGRGICTPSP
jgi:hypothetical protein